MIIWRPCWRKRRSGNLRWDRPVGRGEGEKTNFSRKTGNGRRLRHQTQASVGLLRRRGVWRNADPIGGEDVLETIEQAAQEMVSLTEQVRPRPEGWSLYAQLGQARQIAQAAMGGREVTPFALTESLEQRTTADWGELDRAVQRDARRYDGGFFLY